ncbi:MAG: hypothetical protein WCO03_02965, partial [bacterium]
TGTLPVTKGGTGLTTIPAGWLYSNGTSPIGASTSPTVDWLTAGSSTATSTFAGAMSVGSNSSREKLSVYGNAYQEQESIITGLSSVSVNSARAVAIAGKYAVVAAAAGNRLSIYDVSNPASPALKGALTSSDLGTPRDVYVSGKYAYVADSNSTVAGTSRLYIVDISNPSLPIVRSSIQVGSITGTRMSVYVSGRYAYVADNAGGTLGIFDVSDASNPLRLMSTSTPATPWSVVASGNYTYVTGAAGNGLYIYDTSNPSVPSLITSTTTATNPRGITISGKYAYVVSSGTNNEKLSVYDISNPASLVLVSQTTNQALSLSQPYNIAVAGRTAYISNGIVSGSNGGLVALDISSTTAIRLLSVATSSNYQGSWGIAASGKNIFLTSYQSGRLSSFQVTNTDIPSLVSGLAGISNLQVYDNANIDSDLYVRGGLSTGQNLMAQGSLAGGGTSGSSYIGNSLAIGTTSASARLSVWGSDTSSTTKTFEVVNSASTSLFAIFNNGVASTSNLIVSNTATTGNLIFTTASGSQATITSATINTGRISSLSILSSGNLTFLNSDLLNCTGGQALQTSGGNVV